MTLPTLSVLPLLLATLGVPPGDIARPRLLVSVDVEARAGLNPASLKGALQIARDIWRPYVDIAIAPRGELQRSIEVDELRVVITDRQLAGADDGLGWIEFVNGEPERTITVSTGVATRLMEAATWAERPFMAWPVRLRHDFIMRAIGRSIAHEIGHYLLRSKVHTPTGLMRQKMSVADIMAPGPGASAIDGGQAATLWRRLAELARNSIDGPSRSAAGLPAS